MTETATFTVKRLPDGRMRIKGALWVDHFEPEDIDRKIAFYDGMVERYGNGGYKQAAAELRRAKGDLE